MTPGQTGHFCPADVDRPFGRAVDASHKIEQCALAGAAPPHQDNEFSRFDVQVDAVQRGDRLVPFAKAFGQSANFNECHSSTPNALSELISSLSVAADRFDRFPIVE